MATRSRTKAVETATSDPLQLLRKIQLADLLGVSIWTIDAWRRQGKLPPPLVLSEQTVAWRRVDIEEWLAKQERGHSPRNRDQHGGA